MLDRDRKILESRGRGARVGIADIRELKLGAERRSAGRRAVSHGLRNGEHQFRMEDVDYRQTEA